MRTSGRIIMLVVVGCVLVCSASRSADAAARRGELRGRFVRLVERRVGDREYIGIVVRPPEGKGTRETVLLMGRDTKQAKVARTLREGQKVEAAYVMEGDHRWATRINLEKLPKGTDKKRRQVVDKKRREGADKKRRAAAQRPATVQHMERLLAAIGRLEERIARLEREIRLLRGRVPVRDRVEGKRDRERDREREKGRRDERGDRDRRDDRRREGRDRERDGVRRREGGDREREEGRRREHVERRREGDNRERD